MLANNKKGNEMKITNYLIGLTTVGAVAGTIAVSVNNIQEIEQPKESAEVVLMKTEEIKEEVIEPIVEDNIIEEQATIEVQPITETQVVEDETCSIVEMLGTDDFVEAVYAKYPIFKSFAVNAGISVYDIENFFNMSLDERDSFLKKLAENGDIGQWSFIMHQYQYADNIKYVRTIFNECK